MIKKILNRGIKFILNRDYRFLILSEIGIYNKVEDEDYIRRKYKSLMGKELNLDNPLSFNEKLQWLKLHDRNPQYTTMVDKVLAKQWVANIIGNKYIIPTIGVWNKPEEIDFDLLPDQFVLKCNHNSGTGMYICTNKENINRKKIINELKRGLKQDYYKTSREWPYKNVERRIIAEQYLCNDSNTELMDYKFMCFNGKVKCVFVCSERFSKTGLRVTFFDKNWEQLSFERHYSKSEIEIEKPQKLQLMISLAEKLSAQIPFVRVDFYEVSGEVFFGELTFFPGSGFEEFRPEEWDYTLGKWIVLPDSTS